MDGEFYAEGVLRFKKIFLGVKIHMYGVDILDKEQCLFLYVRCFPILLSRRMTLCEYLPMYQKQS